MAPVEPRCCYMDEEMSPELPPTGWRVGEKKDDISVLGSAVPLISPDQI